MLVAHATPRVTFTVITASLFLKNIAFKFWTKRQDTDTFEFHDSDKAAMRTHLLSAVVHAPDLIRSV